VKTNMTTEVERVKAGVRCVVLCGTSEVIGEEMQLVTHHFKISLCSSD
jgi:hypothetical protein